jgi:hypothetical protein
MKTTGRLQWTLLIIFIFALSGIWSTPSRALPACGEGASEPPCPTPGLNPGLYVQVLDGMINVTNGGGSQNFTAGQFGFTPGFNQPPVILPNNPGLQFTPPPSFSNTGGESEWDCGC